MPARGRKPRSFDRLSVKRELDINRLAALKWDQDRGMLVYNGAGQPGAGTAVDFRGLGMAKDRYSLFENFARVPQLSAVTQAPAADTYATATLLANLNANRDFEVLGTNAVSADVTAYAEGGIKVATHGANNDSTIILPHLTSGQSRWSTTTWGTDQQTRWECVLETGSSVAAVNIWAGLKLTNTPTVATDADQAFFYLSTAATDATHWYTTYSIADTDTETATGLAFAAATKYHLVIDIDSSRIARMYINNQMYKTSTALTNATDFIPYVGVKALTGAVKFIYVYKMAISRKAGA